MPSKRGTDLPFVGEPGKRWRFVEPTNEVKPAANLSGKWEIRIISKEPGNNQVALLEQKGSKAGRIDGQTCLETDGSCELFQQLFSIAVR